MRTYVHPAKDDLPDPDEVWGDPEVVAPGAATLEALGEVDAQ